MATKRLQDAAWADDHLRATEAGAECLL